MTTRSRFDVQKLEGRTVNVALADGSVLGPVPLVLARQNTLWIVSEGEDTFVPLDRVVNVWDAPPFRPSALATAW
jgi:prepilin-type processing-associated H-X9-DG protein